MPPRVNLKRGQTAMTENARLRKVARKTKPAMTSTDDETKTRNVETANEDDICPICHLLLYRPVTTTCKHTLCESCMSHWASASQTFAMTIVGLDDDPSVDQTPLSARCPMCRTPTAASLNTKLHRSLRARYPTLYVTREAEELEQPANDTSIKTLTLYIGNTHRLRPRHPDEDYETSNIHEWSFFVRPVSHTHIIEEVQIFLHPTFRPSRIIRTMPPYEIRRLGWGVFTITAHVILRAGYKWVSGEAERAPDGAEKGMLALRWTLDFDGRGTQGRCRLSVKSEAWAAERAEVEERETERERARMRRAYERDGDWMPPTEE